jgi:hypothetical protein
MRHGLIVAFLVILAGLTIACSGNVSFTSSLPPVGVGASTPREALVEKDIGLQEETVTILATILDQASLNNAKPKLTKVVNQHNGYKQDLQKLGPTPLQESQAIARKYGDRSKTAKENLAMEMTRVNSTVPGGGEVYRQMLDLWQGL